jgi:hypothetical protein
MNTSRYWYIDDIVNKIPNQFYIKPNLDKFWIDKLVNLLI